MLNNLKLSLIKQRHKVHQKSKILPHVRATEIYHTLNFIGGGGGGVTLLFVKL